MAKKEYQKGRFIPRNPEKYVGDLKNIIYRSSWERIVMVEFDRNPNILLWGSEPFPIEYFSQVDGRTRRYFPDFIVKYRNRKGEIVSELIEVKPFKETQPPKKTGGKNSKARFINETLTYQKNQDKWAAAEEFARKNNLKFRVMTEYDIGVKKR